MRRSPFVIYGVVRDPGGSPVELARVSFTAGPVALPDIAALTNSGGAFALTAPAPGAYTLEAVAKGYGPGELKVMVEGDVEGERDVHVEIMLSR